MVPTVACILNRHDRATQIFLKVSPRRGWPTVTYCREHPDRGFREKTKECDVLSVPYAELAGLTYFSCWGKKSVIDFVDIASLIFSFCVKIHRF